MVATLGFLAMMIASSYAAAVETPPIKIVAFGTSLTANQIWPGALAARLAQCLNRPVNVAVVAKAGATSIWARTALPSVIAEKPDIVLIELAVNDSSLQRMMSQQTSTANLREIIARLQAARPNAVIAVLAMNPAHGPRGWMRLRRSSFEAAHKAAVLERHGLHIDLRDNWNQQPDREMRRMIPDGLHPDPATAARIIVPSLAMQIGGKGCQA
jgi:lysophospholipase L1-like esterase